MRCPNCKKSDTKVIDSRITEQGYTTRRRRECEDCSHRFTTYEYVFIKKIVIKKSGERQDYDREKLEKSMRISCKKRPIPEKSFQKSLSNIESTIEKSFSIEIASKDIGALIMEELRNLDKVAFIRFASVYREFEDIGEFKSHIENLTKTQNID